MMAARILPVATAIIWKNGQFLIASRPGGKPFAGYWELPGGKLEPGESPREALARELLEELDIKIRDPEFWKACYYFYPDQNMTVKLYLFNIRQYDGQPRGMEQQQLAWADGANWKNYTFLPADVNIIEELAAGRSNGCGCS